MKHAACILALLAAGCAGTRAPSEAKLVAPGEGRHLRVLGEDIWVKVEPRQTAGAYAVIEERAPAGGGPPPHVHANEDEVFYVLEGDVEFLVGSDKVSGKTGTVGFLPRGIPHTFRNVGPDPCRVLVFISPANFIRFFEEVDAMSHSGPPDKDHVLKLAERYDLEILPPPTAGSK